MKTNIFLRATNSGMAGTLSFLLFFTFPKNRANQGQALDRRDKVENRRQPDAPSTRSRAGDDGSFDKAGFFWLDLNTRLLGSVVGADYGRAKGRLH